MMPVVQQAPRVRPSQPRLVERWRRFLSKVVYLSLKRKEWASMGQLLNHFATIRKQALNPKGVGKGKLRHTVSLDLQSDVLENWQPEEL
jgi:hypothetical protein